MTGEELFNEYKKRSGEILDYEMVSPECVWIWEAAARSISSLKMDHPERQIRVLKAGDAI